MNNCSSSIEGEIIVDECTVLNQSETLPTILYFDEHIQIITPQNNNFAITIFDFSGRCVYSQSQMVNEAIIPINNFTSGIYFLRWENAKTSGTIKWVKMTH